MCVNERIYVHTYTRDRKCKFNNYLYPQIQKMVLENILKVLIKFIEKNYQMLIYNWLTIPDKDDLALRRIYLPTIHPHIWWAWFLTHSRSKCDVAAHQKIQF